MASSAAVSSGGDPAWERRTDPVIAHHDSGEEGGGSAVKVDRKGIREAQVQEDNHTSVQCVTKN